MIGKQAAGQRSETSEHAIQTSLNAIGRFLWLPLLLLPLAVALAWGDYVPDQAYSLWRQAQNVVARRGLAFDATILGQAEVVQAPLFTFLLALSGWLQVPIHTTALLLSALGWSVAAVTLYIVGRITERPPAVAFLPPLLLVTSPILVSTLGTDISWVLALAWLALALTVQGRWRAQTAVLALLLWVHFDLSTLALVVLLWGWQWRAQGPRRPWRSGLVLLAAVLLWGGLATWRFGLPLFQPDLNLSQWQPTLLPPLRQNELYWLFVPFILLGLLHSLRHRRTGKAVLSMSLWLLLAAITGSTVTAAVAAVLAFFLVGAGVDWLGRWLQERELVQLSSAWLTAGLAVMVALPLVAAQGSSLWQQAQTRSPAQRQLEQEVAAWLQRNSQETATVLASPRVGYRADRPQLDLPRHLADPAALPALLDELAHLPPQYLVTARTIGWDFVTRTGWFQTRYQAAAEFSSAYVTSSPYVIWQYQQSDFDVGETQPLNVETELGVDLVGYRYWPQRIQPGEAVNVTLHLQATRPITANFHTIVRMVSPVDGVAWAQRDESTPQSRPVSWWQPKQVIAERFVLTTTQEIPVGAYQLNVSLRPSRSDTLVAMYQNNDVNQLDRVWLGYTAVPWQGTFETAEPIKARLDDQFSLVAAEVAGEPRPGQTLAVKLYWQALRRPDDDYVVFVHLLDEEGESVANGDSRPAGGRFPTMAWIADEIVEDVHSLSLPPDLPAGTYQLKVGMYVLETGQRLPVWDADGVAQPDQSILLQTLRLESVHE